MRGILCQAVIHLGGSLPASNLYFRTVLQNLLSDNNSRGGNVPMYVCLDGIQLCRKRLKHILNNTKHAGHVTQRYTSLHQDLMYFHQCKSSGVIWPPL